MVEQVDILLLLVAVSHLGVAEPAPGRLPVLELPLLDPLVSGLERLTDRSQFGEAVLHLDDHPGEVVPAGHIDLLARQPLLVLR